MKRSRSDVIFDRINVIMLVLLLVVMMYPLYFTIIASLSDPYSVVKGNVYFWPIGFTLEPYANVLNNADVWRGYRNTLFYTVFGTLFSLMMIIPAAYVLSKKRLPGRTMFSWIFLITMYFNGGLVPTYLLVRSLNLINKPYTLIVLGAMNVYNMIVARIYFQTAIPEELYESARMDGANDFVSFFRIALPLAAPITAVMTLFFAVGRWNDYFNALIYTSNRDYQPLQMVLRAVLLQNQALIAIKDTATMAAEELEAMARRAYMAEGMKYSLIFIASAPLLAAYPFVQKYFVRGVMIGSLKG